MAIGTPEDSTFPFPFAKPPRTIPALFAEKQAALLAEVENFRYAAEANTLGDYSELGFLANLMNILMEN